MLEIATIGYEGWGFDLWVEALRSHGVRTVVDVRELPLSRRPGWSKRSLAEKLAARDIGYIHMRGLGTPAPLRHALRDGSLPFGEFAPQFRAILDDHGDDLVALLALARQQKVVLVCWEEDPAHCHRALVVEALQATAGEPVAVDDIRRMSEE